jgi:hypothetical protein
MSYSGDTASEAADENAPPAIAGAEAFDWLQAGAHSTERVARERSLLQRRLMAAKSMLETELSMTLRGVQEEDAEATLLRKLENGVLLCRLVGSKLMTAGGTWRAT